MLHFDIAKAIHDAQGYWLPFFTPNKNMFALYLLTSFGMAWFVWRAQEHQENPQRKTKDFFSYLFGNGIYTHRSSLQDYLIFLLNGIIYYAILAQFILSQKTVATGLNALLTHTFGVLDQPVVSGFRAIALFTLVVAVLFDLSAYCSHWLLHKVPTLWAFHKVHHSAEVMTPITVLRLHPVELIINSVAYALFVGIGMGIFSYVAGEGISEARLLGLNVVIFAMLITGNHLRHSHVWLHYPIWLSRFFISPAQHQIHHSTDEQHFDRNLGLIFSFWDKLCGTLYVPKEKEDIEFGIHKKERNPYASVKEMYVKPFKECWALLRT